MNYTFTNIKNKIFVMFILVLVICSTESVCVSAQDNLDAYFEDGYEGNSNYYRTETRSKKGIQEAYEYNTVYKDLGISHTLINVCVNKLLNGSVAHVYNGKTYYFDYIPDFDPETAAIFNKNDVSITAVLLMQMDDNSLSHNLIHTAARADTSRRYYAWNVYDAAAVEELSALMDFLASTYGRENCHIDNWVVGNEVNMPNAWNYTGTTNVDANVDIAARSFIIVNKAIKRYNSGAKAYLSLDHSWTHNDEGRGIGGKVFLDAFAKKIEELSPGIDWNIAFHPYAPIMTQSNIWNSRNANYYTPNNINAAFISAKNLEILTDYVKENFGENVRIILSEQGFTAYNGQEAQQAAALAYTYYAAEFNDMIDATMFRSLRDADAEVVDKFYFGLFNSDGTKRPAYNVFKYMDTEEWEKYTTACLNTMGIPIWNELVTYFDGQRFIPKPLEEVYLEKTGTVLGVGYKETLEYEVYPEFASTKELKWISSDDSVVKVDANSGELEAVSPGRAVVMAVSGEEDLATCIVVVKDAAESQANVERFVNEVYQAAYGKLPSEEDLRSYRKRLMLRNMTAVDVAHEIIFGKEAMYPSQSHEEFVTMVYKAITNTEQVPQDIIDKYVLCLEAGMSKERVFVDFISTTEFDYRCYDCDIDTGTFENVYGLRNLNVLSYNMDSDVTYTVVKNVYMILGRVPEKNELKGLCSKLISGKISSEDIIRISYETDEFKERNLTNEQFVDLLYTMADIDEVNEIVRYMWICMLDAERITRDELFNKFFEVI